jgi:hypothetical protein
MGASETTAEAASGEPLTPPPVTTRPGAGLVRELEARAEAGAGA